MRILGTLMTSDELQARSDEAGQAGTICWTIDEYRDSEHGKANAHVGLLREAQRNSNTLLVAQTPLLAAPDDH